MDDTGAALAGVAAHVGTGQVQMIAQEMDKERAVLDVGRNRPAVHRQFDFRHRYLPMLLFRLEAGKRNFATRKFVVLRNRSSAGSLASSVRVATAGLGWLFTLIPAGRVGA